MQIDLKTTKSRTIIDFSGNGFRELVVLGKYNYNKVEKNLENHAHQNMIEICYYDKGSQWFEVGYERYLVKGGDVFIHFPGEVHGSGDSPESKGCLYWFLIKCPRGGLNGGQTDGTAYLTRMLIRMNRRHFKGGTEIKKILEEIFKANSTKKENARIKQIKINLLAQTFLLKIIDYANKTYSSTDNERLQDITELIERRMSENISIGMLAKQAHLSESRFKNWFKEVSGFTPLDFVQRKRVEFAVSRIKADPSIDFRDLAYDLNFASQQYFSTVVKKFTGKTPKELRS